MKMIPSKGKPFIRQGDVGLKPAPKGSVTNKSGLRALKNQGGVLKLGEATGHVHKVLEPEKVDFYYDEEGNLVGLCVRERTAIDHQEHTPPIVLEPGEYTFIDQEEYDPEEGRRAIAD